LLLIPGSAQAAQARVWIAEFGTARATAAAPFANMPALVTQPVLDISVTRASSLPFSTQTKYIRVICEVNCVIRNSGTVSQNDIMLPALRPEYFGVAAGTTLSVTAVPP
jgi:hypothetical protein